ncbi:DinB family protein [Thermosporothrix hazakensis]|jgi:hypothetical protein|uniref:DinB family protein n=2 Tax=Thermosporothrix TaxID=768650 RepID=A0A326UAG5_THEHA|nr:DinB family protein [Thermosporothrix hazakensis]PZW31930.1 DinB family protein [Thermosporothrix hazakensis]BBH91600.1 hypothetical protein KTC_63510 [Thermosporothrix sp. COM3]GCE49745.1 hypothetical protein KTH_46140 [Thermosporothrix hazakensis]
MTTIENPNVQAIRQQLRVAYNDLNALLDNPISGLEPEQLYRPAAPGEWSIMENLAHINEFLPYWADEVSKLVAHPGQNFGRTMKHEGRLRAIEEHGHDTLEQARAALPKNYAYVDGVLSKLTDSDLELTGHHVTYGERTLAWFIDEFLVRHVAAHVEQIKGCL